MFVRHRAAATDRKAIPDALPAAKPPPDATGGR
jgi:hypothetical protein